jgi:Arm DNA-binding domain
MLCSFERSIWTGKLRVVHLAARLFQAKDRSVAAARFYGDGKEAEYRIDGNPGLILIIFPPDAKGRRRRVWRCYYSHTVDGRRARRKIRLGAYPSTGLAEARSRAANIMAEVDQGKGSIRPSPCGHGSWRAWRAYSCRYGSRVPKRPSRRSISSAVQMARDCKVE